MCLNRRVIGGLMRKSVACWALMAAAGLAAPAGAEDAAGNRRPEVLYGADDRLNLYQVKHPLLRELAESTVALFDGADLSVSQDAPDRFQLALRSYGERLNLCKEEPFREEPIGAFCSGSLVAPDVVMTAGHCVRTLAACQGARFVFGFSIKEAGRMPTSVARSDVYSCAKILGRKEEDPGADWALVQLDRPVSGRKPLGVNRGGRIAKGTPLLVIGHPSGLPTKVAGGASVRDETPQGYFVANLDTYGGNSGSEVFNAQTGLVEGILVRGEVDYVTKGECRVSNQCADDGCRGEDVTKVGETLPGLPPSSLAKSLRSRGEAALLLLGAGF